MQLLTPVDIERPPFQIEPCERVLTVGSCFADGIGRRFLLSGFPATVNPFGTMYNPASVLHSVSRLAAGVLSSVSTAFLTLGTNHVYVERSTSQIVDNCQKRPQRLFREELLTVGECADYLRQAIALLRSHNPSVRVVLTVSPIRYRKYGYHGSQLSKAVLLLAADEVVREASGTSQTSRTSQTSGTSQTSQTSETSQTSRTSPTSPVVYFPAYEILSDELRDYRFYAPDMLHPSEQAVDYIWQRLTNSFFSDAAKRYLDEWQPLRQALEHKPFNPDGDEYRTFRQQTLQRLAAFREKYPLFSNPFQADGETSMGGQEDRR